MTQIDNYNQVNYHQPKTAANPPVKPKVSAGAIFFSVIFTLTMMILQVRGLYDINRFFNPHYQVCLEAGYSTEVTCPDADYALQQVLWWSYLSVPLFIIFFILALVLRKKFTHGWQRAFFITFIILSYFLGIEILIYLTVYLFQYHKDIAWYSTLGTLALLSVVLIIWLERRQAVKRLTKGDSY